MTIQEDHMTIQEDHMTIQEAHMTMQEDHMMKHSYCTFHVSFSLVVLTAGEYLRASKMA